MFSPFPAIPQPEYFLNRKNDVNSDDEAHCIDFDHLADEEACLTSNRSPNYPFIGNETRDRNLLSK